MRSGFPAKIMVMGMFVGLLVVGCEEADSIKKMKVQTERQALAVRDLTLENEKLSEQNKKQGTELEAVKKSLAAEKSAVDALRKDKDAAEQQGQALRTRVAELEKEVTRLNRLVQDTVENYNKLAKELKQAPPAPAPSPAPPKSAPAPGK